jgi:hypothetical protein
VILRVVCCDLVLGGISSWIYRFAANPDIFTPPSQLCLLGSTDETVALVAFASRRERLRWSTLRSGVRGYV